MTLQALAGDTDLSVSFVSQVERGQVLPSITTLQKLAGALQVAPGQLMDGELQTNPVVRSDQRMRLRLPNSMIDRECLTPGLNHKLQVFQATLGPGECSSEVYLQHDSEEFMMVLEGALEVQVGDAVYRLEAGDTILFFANVPHRTRGCGAGAARYIVVNTPPVI
jgi:quercetin dioxygenase-like cupin family protein